MANCKYCHQPISRLDKEVCPFCGGARPLDGTDTSTQDITKVIGQIDNAVEIKHKKRIVTAILSFIFGIFGAHLFYLGKAKKALINLAITLVIIGAIGSIIFFAAWKSALAYLIPYFVLEIVYILIGIGYLTRHDIVDSHGEFLE